MDVAYADVNIDTVELLKSQECEVIIPRSQVCCGSVQAHHGDRVTALQLTRENIKAFSRYDLDAIILNSAGCGAFMKDYGQLFINDPELSESARELSSKVKDITEFLHEIGFKAKNTTYNGKRITYHDACHLVHTQKISTQPRELIQSAQGIDFVELPEANWCCGSAGIYNITHYDDSMKLLDRKLEHIRKVNPDIIVTGNPGCLAQLAHGLKQSGLEIELLHTSTFLRRASET